MSQHHHARPVATTLRLLRPALLVLLLLALLFGAAASLVVWLAKSEDGTRWLFARLPGVQAEGVRGALLGSRFEIDRLRVTWSDGQASATLLDFRGDGLVWTWQPRPLVWVGLSARRLSVRDLHVLTAPTTAETPRPTLPSSLALPVQLAVDELRIGEIRVDAMPPIRSVAARLMLGLDGRHRIEALQLERDGLELRGRAEIADASPFALEAELQLMPRQGDAFAATLRAGGTLERVELDALLRGPVPGRGRAAPSADVRATLLPFAPWPLAALSASTRALDLSVLGSALPQTALSGSAQVQSRAADAPFGATLQIENTLPGRWDERRLPLRRATLALQAQAQQRERVDIQRFDLALAQGDGRLERPAGRWRGSGQWLGHTLTLDTVLESVLPQRLHGSAPAMQLSGPLAFTLHGLPSPDPADASATPAASIELRTSLDGRLDAAPQAVKLALQASASAERIEIRQMQASAGGAQASAQARALRGAGGAWALSTTGSLTDFDPLPWWPGSAGGAWRQGPHRVSGGWQFDVRLPARAGELAPLALLQSVAGTGTLRLHDSLLAGVPLALTATLGQMPSSAGTPGTLRAEVALAGNRLVVDGRGDPAGRGDGDRWQLELDAPALPALAPLLRLDPALAAWVPRSGSASASIGAQGRWPNLRTEGRAALQGLQVAELSLASGKVQWLFDTGLQAQQPLEMQAEFTTLAFGKQRLDLLRADLRGTWLDHRLELSAALPVTPPAAAQQVLGIQTGAGTRARVRAAGSWQGEPGGGGRWRGGIDRLEVGAWAGGTELGDITRHWADARDLRAELQFDASGALVSVQASKGTLTLADTLSLRWDEVAWNPRSSGGHIELRADIAPFAVAPLLARVQPAVGWGGDLRVGARLVVRAAERFDADIVVERSDGDLHVSDDRGVQPLGLSAVRLALAAHDGKWSFTQALAGSTMGLLQGEVNVTTTPERRWPPADAPMAGLIEARVANLGVWGSWVPAGWRLSGALLTSAVIGGRFGAPEYTGTLRGTDLGVRNLLEGVNISQGTVAVQLNGDAARIETMRFKAGDGTLDVTGGATFGAEPAAQLKLVAQRFRVLGRIDRQISASGSADLLVRNDIVKLDGKFTVDEGLFDTSRGDAPGLDEDVTVRRAGAVEEEADVAAAPKPRRNVAVTVDVDLGNRLRVRGRGLDTELRGQLRITTPNGRLSVAGTVNTERGTYAAYGQKLEIERGILAFTGPPDNPRLDILALRPNIDQQVGVEIGGFLQNVRVRLYSDTDMSETDKLSWLVLGRAPDELGRNDTALLQRAAVALLSGEGDAPTDTLLKNLGIDELSLRQSDGDVRETVVTLGKQLSRRWYVGYERGVNATIGTWQLIYRIAQRFTLRAQSGLENSIDIIWVWRVDEVALPLLPGMTKSKPPPP